jgi:uncharacterized protein DUF362
MRAFWLSPALASMFLASVSRVAGAEPSALLSPDKKSALVVSVHDAKATDAFRARPESIRAMVECGLTNLTETPEMNSAWRSLISTQDVVGIKVFSTPGPNSGTRPAVVEALVMGLISAGVPSKQIVIWDRHQTDLRLAGYYDLAQALGIRIAGAAEAGYDESAFYETSLMGSLVWGDLEFGRKGSGVGRKSFVTKLLTRDITKIINVTPLLNHDQAGVCGNLYSLATGSVDNTGRFESDVQGLATAIPEIYALTNLSDHVVLNITDALICQYEGSERGLLHYSTALNELRFSRDPVALDVLSVHELEHQREAAHAPTNKPKADLYNNAALLELGTSDVKKIKVRKIETGP